MSYKVTENTNKKEMENTAIPEGEYLVTLERSVEKESQAGNKYLSLMFRIKQGQSNGNRCVFKSIFKDDSGQYKFSFLEKMLLSLGIKGKEYNSIDEVLKELDNKDYLAFIKIDEKDSTRNYISYFKEIPELKNEDMPFDIDDLV